MNDTMEDLITRMGQGNIGAVTVLCKLLNKGDIDTIMNMEALNIRGSGIWILYKGICRENLDDLKFTVRRQMSDLICKGCNDE